MVRFIRITGGGPRLAGKDLIPKILWIKENLPDVYRETFKILDSNGFLIYKAAGKTVISRFDANLTWLMDQDQEDTNGQASDELNLPEGIPVIVGAGDLASAAVGSSAVKEGEYFIYIGTSDFIGTRTKNVRLMFSTIWGSLCSAIPDVYLYTGEQETAGTCLDWVKDQMFKKENEMLGDNIYDFLDEVASRIPPGSQGLIFTPWLSGEKTQWMMTL